MRFVQKIREFFTPKCQKKISAAKEQKAMAMSEFNIAMDKLSAVLSLKESHNTGIVKKNVRRNNCQYS